METGPAEGGGQLVLEAIDLSVSVPLPDTADSGTAGSDHGGASDADGPSPAPLNHFNLLVRRTDRIGIVGPNGIGKSTLVRVLLGLAETGWRAGASRDSG